ncbi:hypothetical protein QTU61_000792 [Campylobacter lari]|nr:hypothetical protein [Campylobacter lari]
MTAYVHIGTHKTGTTSIQLFLKENIDLLQKQGIYCPQSTTMWNRIQHRMLKPILEECFNNRIDRNSNELICHIKTEHYRHEIDNLKNEINLNKNKKFLFSDEGFSWWFADKEKVKLIKFFFNELGFKNIVIILYLREFQDFFNSLTSEDIKNGRMYFKTNLYADKNPYINSFDYAYICKNYSDIFGKENMTVRLFDKNEFYQGDLLKDFIHSIGLEWDNEFIIPPKQNETLDLIGIELLDRFNNILPKDANFIIDRFFQNSKDPHLKFQAKKELMQSYLNHFKESNEWVRKEFFPHKERLFPKKDLSNYKENYELKEMKPEYWDKIAEFIADIIKDKNEPSNTIFKKLRFYFRHPKEMFKLIRSYIARNKN